MARIKKSEIDALANPSFAREQTMLTRLLTAAKSFYQNPQNVQAFEAWKKQKEAIHNDANHLNA